MFSNKFLFFLLFFLIALIFSGCEGNNSKTKTLPTPPQSEKINIKMAFKPSETFKLAFSALKKGDYKLFQKCHLKTIQPKLEKKAFDNNHVFMKLNNPKIIIEKETIKDDKAEIIYIVKMNENGIEAQEKDSCTLKFHLGKWYISSI